MVIVSKKLQKCNLPENKKQFEKIVKNVNKDICSYLGVNKRSYGCDMDEPCFSKATAEDPKRGKSGIINIKKVCVKYQQKLKKTKILNQDFKTVVKKHDNKDSFTYLDPPFHESREYSAGKVDPKEICELAKEAKGKSKI